ncbi:MAG: response regulator, partial [Thioalkalispiraceae bacterium]
MAVRVLVVDDSGFFRRRVTEMLEADNEINVIGAAENGKIAVEKVKELRPDVVTMDIEMPEMDGITATREIMKSRPTRIIMFSSLTTDGAKATLDALDAGALDFLPKRFEDISSDREEAKKLLCERVKQLV